MNFKDLIKEDVSTLVEQKGKFDYLAWAYAIEKLRLHEPEATIRARLFDGKPFIDTGNGLMVEFYIMLKGEEVWCEFLPVLDFKNKAIVEPSAYDINKAFQRCKTKCIAEYTGIGLYLYRKESSAPTDKKEPTKKITIGAENLKDLGRFCKKHGITTDEKKEEFIKHYKIDIYKTTISEFNDIFEKVFEDYGDEDSPY